MGALFRWNTSLSKNEGGIMEKEMKTENMPVFFLEIQRRGAQEVDKTKEKKKKR